ncbi:MAG: sodium ion-translocating decarboxylase subunit beta, partial [Opitutales bacterium]|nr:sodium ion-translocating decarboxylase subunit beta [Opitutales bacterium]
MTQSLIDLLFDTSIFYVDWRMIVMWVVVAVLMYLAVYKEFEPLLLVPIAFGALLANLPTEGVVNKPAGEIISPTSGQIVRTFAKEGGKVFVPRVVKQIPVDVADIIGKEPISFRDADAKVDQYFTFLEEVTSPESRKDTFKKAKGIPDLIAIVRPDSNKVVSSEEKFKVNFRNEVLELHKDDIFVWAQASGDVTDVFATNNAKVDTGERIVNVYSARTGGLYHYLQLGVLLEIFPPLIFLGVGALTDFGPLIANPKTLLLGGAAQFGVFATFIGAYFLGFSTPEAASIGIIGGA